MDLLYTLSKMFVLLTVLFQWYPYTDKKKQRSIAKVRRSLHRITFVFLN